MIGALLQGVGAAVVFLVVVGVVSLLCPFVAQIWSDATRHKRSGFLMHHSNYRPHPYQQWKEQR